MSKNMNKKWIIGLVVLAVVLIGAYAFYNSGATVAAVGYSNIEASPDEVSVYVTIEGKGETAAIAKAQYDLTSDAVLDALDDVPGLEEEDVKIVNYNIYPEYDYSPTGGSTQKGYIATSQLQVKLEEFDNVADVVDAAVMAGATVSYINFELSEEKQSEYKSQALEAASADARKKAEATAAGLGKNLGKLVAVEAEEFNYGPYPYYAKAESASGGVAAMEARDAALNLAPQDIQVSASIRVEYKLRAF